MIGSHNKNQWYKLNKTKINDKLTKINDKLTKTNDKPTKINDKLNKTNDKLKPMTNPPKPKPMINWSKPKPIKCITIYLFSFEPKVPPLSIQSSDYSMVIVLII